MSGRLFIHNCMLDGGRASIFIEDGLITKILPCEAAAPEGCAMLDAGGRTAAAGMIDPHVHMRCPGLEYKEDWQSGSAAALAGGVTTVIDMPNTKPATETLEALDMKRAASAKADLAGPGVRRMFWAGVSSETLAELPLLLREPDVAGVKLFFSETSGNNASSDPGFIRKVFRIAAAVLKPAAVHSELGSMLNPGIWDDEGSVPAANLLRMHGIARPAAAAETGTAVAVAAALETGCPLYICHVSTAAELKIAAAAAEKAAARGLRIAIEITPHHLLLDEDVSVSGGPQSWAKVNPPLRTPQDRAALAAVLESEAVIIGSDHAPHSLEEKNADFRSAPSGFPGLETSLRLAASFRPDLYGMLTAERAARFFGLSDRGRIAEGLAADIVLLDIGTESRINASGFRTKAAYSPFNGKDLPVSVYKTIIGGRIVG